MKNKQHVHSAKEDKKSELELFDQFYSEMTTSEMTDEKRKVMSDVIEKVLKEEVVK